MDPDVEAFQVEWRTGDRDKAREMAKLYVEARGITLAQHLEKYSQDQLVTLLEEYRDRGMDEDVSIIDMWLLAKYPPKHISAIGTVGSPGKAIPDDQELPKLV